MSIIDSIASEFWPFGWSENDSGCLHQLGSTQYKSDMQNNVGYPGSLLSNLGGQCGKSLVDGMNEVPQVSSCVETVIQGRTVRITVELI